MLNVLFVMDGNYGRCIIKGVMLWVMCNKWFFVFFFVCMFFGCFFFFWWGGDNYFLILFKEFLF